MWGFGGYPVLYCPVFMAETILHCQPFVLYIQDAINSTSSITQNLTTELIDGQRKLVALVAAGNTKAANPISMQQTGAPMPGLPEMVNIRFQHVVYLPTHIRSCLGYEDNIFECSFVAGFVCSAGRGTSGSKKGTLKINIRMQVRGSFRNCSTKKRCIHRVLAMHTGMLFTRI